MFSRSPIASSYLNAENWASNRQQLRADRRHGTIYRVRCMRASTTRRHLRTRAYDPTIPALGDWKQLSPVQDVGNAYDVHNRGKPATSVIGTILVAAIWEGTMRRGANRSSAFTRRLPAQPSHWRCSRRSVGSSGKGGSTATTASGDSTTTGRRNRQQDARRGRHGDIDQDRHRPHRLGDDRAVHRLQPR